MELILINEKKLKIMLTPEDMREYEIDCESVDYGKTETRRAFWSILDEAKHRTGFDAASERVYIQLYPSKEGGCEMYVTKLGFTAPDESIDIAEQEDIGLAYHFTELDPLLRVCRQLNSMKNCDNVEAYRAEDGYYLMLGGTPPDSLLFIGEFGKKCDIDAIKTYLAEHGARICDNAAATLGGLV